ncbi:MAG: folylpolyglutamate synthase/dihydrofolate synthase family protein [Acidobacteriota bacterium]
MKFGLENITQLVECLGHPQQTYQTVHVAGTNGKGSFSAMLATILAQAAIPVGLYTSPHLIKIEERFRFNLTPIQPDHFCQLMERVKSSIDRLLAEGSLTARPTFFEHVTALGFEYFRESRAKLAVIEVGLGGRLDATNIVTPALSVITKIDYDHQQYLGETLTAIASEKAGILKPGVPAFIAPQVPAAAQAIAETAAQVGTPLHWLDPAQLRYREPIDGHWRFDLLSKQQHYQNISVGLRGRHQVETAALAILAAEYLATVGFPIGPEQIRRGIATVQWPGRLELVPTTPPLLLDGAHNPGGTTVLRRFLDEWLPTQPSRQPLILIFSAMRDKDLLAMAEILFGLFDKVILVERDDPRAADFRSLQGQLASLTSNFSQVPGVAAAWAEACAATASTGLIVATGSLHLIGDLKKLLQDGTYAI